MDTAPGADIGELLRTTRETKRLSLARVAEDTNIGLAYLTGLETDDYSCFPGEPYILGFLRNYAEYLELDPSPLVDACRKRRTGIGRPDFPESAGEVGTERSIRHGRSAPQGAVSPEAQTDPQNIAATTQTASGQKAMEVKTPKPFALAGPRFILPLLAVLTGGVVVALLVLRGLDGQNQKGSGKPATPVEYRVEGSAFEKRIYPGDSLLVVVNADTYKLKLAAIGETVDIETPMGISALMLGEETHLDFNKDQLPEIKLTVGDFSRKEEAAGALVRIEFIARKSPDSAFGTDVRVEPDDIQDAGPTARKTGILFRSARGPYPFVATVTFRASCMFRYEADKRDWKERYYSKGETITVNADNSLVVWASNAQAAKITIMASGGKTADLELGAPGEVAVKRIGWSLSEGSWIMSAVEHD